MYRGFNLKIDETQLPDTYEIGKGILSRNEVATKSPLKSFVDNEGYLDASLMKKDWFPEITASVFISHSHNDEATALKLAGWLYSEFRLRSFIDSCVWGYSDELLKLVDDEHCYQIKTNTYSYSKRNKSTSHIHMILSTALYQMIDKCECVFFLNTPDSICSEDAIKQSKTFSPWLFAEIAATQLIRIRTKEEHRGERIKIAGEVLSEAEHIPIRYPVDLSHLTDVDSSILNKWNRRTQIKNYTWPLDALYAITSMNE